MNKPKVTIITPIYNVEKYIERCVVSLFEQDFEDIEYLFVNDCTPDNSVEILEKIIEKYPNRKPNIKIIHHEKNRGLGWARNTGLKHATGKYILHTDSDDWCDLNMVSSLYSKAKETDADIVCCDMLIEGLDTQKYIKTPQVASPQAFLTEIIKDNMCSSLCTKLIKRSLYIENNMYPPKEISTREDGWLLTRLLVFAKKITYVDTTFYHYRMIQGSISKSLSEKHYNDLKFYAETTEQFLKQHNLWEQNKDYLCIEILQCIISFTYKTENYEECFKMIDFVYPKANKLKYLWGNSKINYGAKIKYSLLMLGLHRMVKVLLKIKKK